MLRSASAASKHELSVLAVDGAGKLVFPATVLRVESDGRLVLRYDHGFGEGVELPDWVSPRVEMPWHPHQLREALVVMLRRNVGHGQVLEGLEVRWFRAQGESVRYTTKVKRKRKGKRNRKKEKGKEKGSFLKSIDSLLCLSLIHI